MDNNIVQTIYDTLAEHTVSVAEAVAEHDRLEAKIKDNRYSQQVLQKEIFPKRDAAKQNIEKLVDAAMKDVNGKIEQYKQDAADMNNLDPAALTDDIKLLQSGITLMPRDIQGILKRNEGNRTMTQIVLRYAQEHDIDTGGTYYIGGQQEAETARNLETICHYYKGWIDKPNARDMLDRFFGIKE